LVFITQRFLFAMTDEEFERLKEAEKQHLREKKRMRKTLEALKRRNRAEGLLQKMKHGAQRLLQETETLVDTLRSQGARNEARLEVAVEDQEPVDDLQEAEEELREERAESLVRQYKAATGSVSRSAEEEQEASDAAPSSPDGPDKTIGRMRTARSDEEDAA
jgi:hypothetical protein